MSIIRVTEGENITNIEKGWTVFTDTFDAYAGQFSHFTASDGTIFGNPKEDKSEETQYFKEGNWYSDLDCHNGITQAAIGQVVYFRIKTQNITDENATVALQLYDQDGGAGGADDPINVREVNSDGSAGQLITEKRVNSNEIVYNLTLSDGLAGFIEDDFGDEIELYFQCSYKEEYNVKLPLTSDLYLKVELCDKNVIKSFNNKHYGNCDFYRFRYDDFMRRHKYCGHMPPVYYFGEMRELSSWSVIDNIAEWWTPSLTDEMKQISVSVEEVEKKGTKYKPVPSTSYGFKYCTRFSRVLMPTLTQRGQIWLTEARFKLQKYMEQGVIDKTYSANYDVIILDSLENNFNDNFKKFNWSTMSYEFDQEMQTKYYTNIEIDNDKFQDFAFATHPDAYDPVKMSYLSADDLLKVMSTPDMKEWLGSATWAQALIMARNLNYRENTEATLNRFFKKYILGDDGFK